jgi:hypothetical protein
MMASGLEKQLDRCNGSSGQPSFCNDTSVYNNARQGYNNLWDAIEANSAELRTEVWSWVYNNGFQFRPLGDLPAPGGGAQTESDIIQVQFTHLDRLTLALESNFTILSTSKPKLEIGF